MTVSDPLTRTHEARRLGRVHLARDGLHETRAPAIASMPLRAHPTSRVSPWDIPSATTILSVMVALRALHPGLFNGGGSGKCPNLVHCRPSHYRPDHSGSWTEHPISHLFRRTQQQHACVAEVNRTAWVSNGSHLSLMTCYTG